MAAAARGLATLFVPEAIVTSPVLRARQTAEILAKTWRCPVRELDALGRGDHEGTVAALNGVGYEAIAVVGHEPWMSELLAVLLAGEGGAVVAPFKKGGAALVETGDHLEAGSGGLVWFLPPGVLRQLA